MRKFRKILCLILTIIMVVSALGVSVYAVEARESENIWQCSTNAVAIGNGKVRIDFDITATKPMTKLGASVIYVYSADGALKKTFNSNTYTNMMTTGGSSYCSSVTYSGPAGVSYYAVVVFSATDSSGSCSKNKTTNTVTAK